MAFHSSKTIPGWVLLPAVFLLAVAPAAAQVFVVGEKTATANIATDFTPTHVLRRSTDRTRPT